MLIKLFIVFVLIAVGAFLASSLELRPSEIIVFTSGQTIASLGFYNSGDTATFTGEFNRGLIALTSSSVDVNQNSYGSFSLVINSGISPGVYFDTLNISKDGILLFEVPVVFVVESINREKKYDALIKIDPNDIYFIGGDLIVSPDISLFKLNFDLPSSNVVVLKVYFYSIDGELIDSSVESITVSQQTTIGRSYNLGAFEQEDLLMVAVAENDGTTGIDLHLQDLRGAMGLSLSPPRSYSFYSLFIYFSVVFLLLGFLILTILYLSRYIFRHRENPRRFN